MKIILKQKTNWWQMSNSCNQMCGEANDELLINRHIAGMSSDVKEGGPRHVEEKGWDSADRNWAVWCFHWWVWDRLLLEEKNSNKKSFT